MNKNKKTPIVILHGWGNSMSGEKYADIKKLLEKKEFIVFTPDLPGFGNNPLKKEVLQFEDYINFVYEFITKTLKAKKIILLGHSFGGRIAIRFTAEHPNLVDKLILTGASGIPRPLPSLKKKLIYYLTKGLRPIFVMPPFSYLYSFFRKAVYYSIGEMDYYKAGNLQETFKNVYQVSIQSDLVKIKIPTLIIWGRLDTFTPIEDGELMHKEIANSQLVIIPDASHKLPYERPDIFVKTMLPFVL